MKPFIKLADGTLLVTTAIGSATSTARFETREGSEKQVRETTVLSTSGAVLYELATIIDHKNHDELMRPGNVHRAIMESIEKAIS